MLITRTLPFMIHVHISPFHAFFIHYLFEIHRSRGEKTREDMVLPLDLKVPFDKSATWP